MNAIVEWMKGEPVAILVGGIYGVVQAFLELLISFHVHLTTQQVLSIDGFVVAVAVLLARGQVTPSQITGGSSPLGSVDLTKVGKP